MIEWHDLEWVPEHDTSNWEAIVLHLPHRETLRVARVFRGHGQTLHPHPKEVPAGFVRTYYGTKALYSLDGDVLGVMALFHLYQTEEPLPWEVTDVA
jgi:hypothetical protein